MTEIGRRDVLRGVAGIAALSVLPSVASAAQSVVDETGQKAVTVEVGADGNGGNFAFSPATVRIDPGATVIWKWTGKGGAHNVVAEDGSFESELYGNEGATFKHTFDEQGVTKYACEPHQAMGMKGTIVVGGEGGMAPAESGLSMGELALGGSLVTALLSPIVFALLLFGRRSRDRSASSQSSTSTPGAKRPQP